MEENDDLNEEINDNLSEENNENTEKNSDNKLLDTSSDEVDIEKTANPQAEIN